MSDPHGHPTHSHHSHETEDVHGKLSDREKLARMVAHWIHHNEEHARSYRDWAQRARSMGQEEAGRLLETVAGSTELQNRDLEKILPLLQAKGA